MHRRRFVVWNWLKIGIIGKVMITFLCVSALYATGYFWEPARTPWSFALTTFAGALIFWYDCRFIISKPLESLLQTSKALAKGDVEHKVRVISTDEFGELADSYAKVIAFMKEMSDVAARVADGDLTVPVKPRSDKDKLAIAFLEMIARQRDLTARVKSVATNVAEASKQLARAAEQTAQATQQIASTMQQVAKGAGEQSTSLQETARSVDHLAAAIGHISGGAQEQAVGVEDATGIVKRVSGAISEISNNAGAGVEAWQNTAASAAEGARITHETVTGMGQGQESYAGGGGEGDWPRGEVRRNRKHSSDH